MAQFVRDARIAMIYEGANGIQALDLVGRKLAQGRRPRRHGLLQGGRRLLRGERAPTRRWRPIIKPLKQGARTTCSSDHVVHAERHGEARQCRRRRHRLHAPLRPRRAGLHVGARWRRPRRRRRRNGNGAADRRWTPSSSTGRFFMERMLPETGAHLARISSGADADDGAAGGGVLITASSPSGARAPIRDLGREAALIRASSSGSRARSPADGESRTRRDPMPDAFIYDARPHAARAAASRTAALHEVTALRLAATALRAIRERNGLDTRLVDDVILGCVDPVGEAGGDIARAAALVADYGDHVPGVQINRFCASGLDAVNFAAAQVDGRPAGHGHRRRRRVDEPRRHGRVRRRLAGRSRHRDQVLLHAAGRLGRPHRHEIRLLPRRRRRLCGRKPEARRASLGRGPLRELGRAGEGRQRHHAARQRRAHAARRPTCSRSAALKPSFVQMGEMGGFDAVAIEAHPEVESVNHVHHAGNSSGIVDGAAAVLVGSKEAGEAAGLKPRARIRAFANIGSEPALMLTGPVDVTEKVLRRAGMTHRRHRPVRDQRGLRLGGAALTCRPSTSTRPRSTSTAAPSPWAIRSAPPAR